MNLGYLVATAIFGTVVWRPLRTDSRQTFPSVLYWFTIIATTTVGTTMDDLATRSLGSLRRRIGVAADAADRRAGRVVLCVRLDLCGNSQPAARRSCSTGNHHVKSDARTALGDWTADTAALGYIGAGIIFGGLLLGLAAALPLDPPLASLPVLVAFVLTRPLGPCGRLPRQAFGPRRIGLDRYVASWCFRLHRRLHRTVPPAAAVKNH
jgi:uncharacterized membrane-anchored protein